MIAMIVKHDFVSEKVQQQTDRISLTFKERTSKISFIGDCGEKKHVNVKSSFECAGGSVPPCII